MYLPSFHKKTFLLLIAMTGVLAVVHPLKGVIMVLLILHAVRGPRQIIEAFTVAIFLTLCNQALGTGFSVLRWPLLFASFARIVWDLARERKAMFRTAIVPILFVYAGAAVFFAFFVSDYVSVSVLKATTFFIGTFTILNAFRLSGDREYFYGWFATFYAYIVWGSLLARFLPNPYLGGLFKGLFNHPQALGGFLIPFTTWVAVALLCAQRRPLWLSATFALGFYWVYTTGSRTAMLGILLSICITAAVAVLHGDEWRTPLLAGARRLALPGIALAVVLGGVAGPRIVEGARAFLQKGESAENVGEAFEGSRGFLIDQQMENFHRSPIVGIGFGVPSEKGDLTIKQSGFLGLPSGASVEKGFLPSAVLEEMGLVGAALMVVLVLALFRAAWMQHDPALMALFVGALLVNAGEMIFFSPTSLGVFMWLSFGLATTHYGSADAAYAPRLVHRKPTSHFASRSLQAG